MSDTIVLMVAHTQQPWWKERVFYQIYPRSFNDTNNDGIGDIPGIIEKLDYLKELGIGALWLSPVYKSPNDDYGYDIADYYAINPEFGTMADMKRLLREAGKRDIKIIMDLVVNHTSDEHEWFQKGRDPKSKYHDYYIWKPGKKKGNKELPPNNWQSFFSGSAWQKDEVNGKYYLHLFSKKQPDLNYRNPKVVEEVKNIMRFWLELGVAGFRCDVINLLYKRSFADGKNSLFIRGSEYYLSTAGCHRILREINEEVLQPYGAFTVGETVGVDLASAKRFANGELSTVFSFDHTTVDYFKVPLLRGRYHPKKLKDALVKWQHSGVWNTLFFENHDQPRSISRFGDEDDYHYESATMLATILLTLQGTPFIYQGQEIGMTNYPFRSPAQLRDVSAHNVYTLLRRYNVNRRLAWQWTLNMTRDHARTPMQWTSGQFAGFSTTKPWLPVNQNHSAINVDRQQHIDRSPLNYYQQLIALRQETPALREGTFEQLASPRNVFMYRRKLHKTSYIVVVNMGRAAQRVALPNNTVVCLSNYERHSNVLGPYEAMILKES